MSNLRIVRYELSRLYFNSKNTIERFKILNEVEEMIKVLRQSTINNMDQLEQQIAEEAKVILSDKQKEVLARIHSIVADVTGTRYEVVYKFVIPEATIEHLYENLALDSLDLIELMMALEYEFSVEISDERAVEFKTVQEILNFVTK